MLLSHVIYVYTLHVLVVYIVGAIIHMLTICKYLRICIHTHIYVCVCVLFAKIFSQKKKKKIKMPSIPFLYKKLTLGIN